jgi:hypothetical protein
VILLNKRTVGWGLAGILLVAAVTVFGCSGQKNTVAPAPMSSAKAAANGELGVSWKWIDKTHIEKTYYLDGRDIHGQHVTIGPITVIYVCDYPLGYYGPPAPGHCYTDGTGCN